MRSPAHDPAYSDMQGARHLTYGYLIDWNRPCALLPKTAFSWTGPGCNMVAKLFGSKSPAWGNWDSPPAEFLQVIYTEQFAWPRHGEQCRGLRPRELPSDTPGARARFDCSELSCDSRRSLRAIAPNGLAQLE